jgi:HAD superfamily hydrolase (TIGR01450 family)
MQAAKEIDIGHLLLRYQVLLLDAYGVLVNQSQALAGAGELITHLNRMGKSYYILTNDASKLPQTISEKLAALGLSVEPDRIITSGALLIDYFSTHHLAGAPCVVLGPPDSARYVEKAGGVIVTPENHFDVLVIGDESGFPFLETIDAVLTALFHKLDHDEKVHLLLPNPDLIYPKTKSSFGIASGSIALILEAAMRLRYPQHAQLGFKRLGKPHIDLFAKALQRSKTRNMVMIGDQLETDIKGANAFGIHSALMISSGITVSAAKIFGNLCPTYYLRDLKFAKLSG